MRSAVRNWRVDSRHMTRLTSRSARRAAMSSKLMPPRPLRVETREADVLVLMCSDLSRWGGSERLHGRDELFDPFVDAAVRVLAEDGPLRLVVELEVDPVDSEIPAALLRAPDEIP